MIAPLRRAALVAGQDLLDLARQKGTWISMMILPFVNVALMVMLPGYLSEREQTQQDRTEYQVAVQGDAADAAAVSELLASAGFDPQRDDDAEDAVTTRRAHVGLVVDDGAAEALAGDGQASMRIVAVSTRRASNLAFGRLVTALDEARSQLALTRVEARGLPPRVARPLTPVAVDLADTDRGARLEFASILPLVVMLPIAGAIGIAAQRISGSKDQRVFEPLLVLPVSRRTLLGGKALSGLALGSITLPAVVLPLLIARFAPVGDAGRAVHLTAGTMAGITALGFGLLVFLVCIGALMGAASRTSAEMGSILPFATFPILLTPMSLQFLGGVRTTALLAMTPVFGPALVIRDLGAGVAVGPNALIALVGIAIAAAVMLVAAARFLDRESNVLRVS